MTFVTLPAGLEEIEINVGKAFHKKSPLEIKILKGAGIIATLVGIISIIPIAIKVWKTKKTEAFPHFALILAVISNSLWVAFGLYTGVKASLLSGSLYLAFYLFIYSIKLRY